MDPGLDFFVLVGLVLAVLLAMLVSEVRTERLRRRELARVCAATREAERNVHRIVGQAQAEILQLVRERRSGNRSAPPVVIGGEWKG